MIAYRCDLCNEVRECVQREMDHTEYDICAECWNALLAKLKGKGRPTRAQEILTLPTPPSAEPAVEPDQPPFPGAPPKIYTSVRPVN